MNRVSRILVSVDLHAGTTTVVDKAARLAAERIAEPLLVGPEEKIREAARSEWVLSFAGFQQFKKAAAIAAAAIGEYVEAEAFFSEALDEAERVPIKLEQPEVRRWFAKMLIVRNASGDRPRARELLEEAIDGYRVFAGHEEDVLKVVLKP